MKNSSRNIILILALSAVALMLVGLYLYDYVPTSLTVAQANRYETASETTELMSDAQTAQDLLKEQTYGSTSQSGSTSSVTTNIILNEYTISKTDIAMAENQGIIDRGRPDPFAEVNNESVAGEGQDGESGNQPSSGNNTTVTAPSDGTFYNTSHQK